MSSSGRFRDALGKGEVGRVAMTLKEAISAKEEASGRPLSQKGDGLGHATSTISFGTSVCNVFS